MASKNDVTGDSIQTKVTSDSYRKNWANIFKKDKDKKEEKDERKDSK